MGCVYSAQQENVEAAGQEVKNIIDDIELAQKELTLKREELEELKEAQESRKAQLSRLSQLAQPIETDVTYLFNEKPLKNNGKGLVESVPLRHQAPPNAYKKQVKTGELLQLESKLHDVTRMAYGRFSEFDTTFVNANILSRQCEDTVVDKVQSSIDRAASLIAEMDHLDQQSFFSVSELLRLRLNIMVAQRLEVEELENLTKEREYFEKKERELHEQLLTEVKQMKIRLKHGKLEIDGFVRSILYYLCNITIELATCTRDLQRQLNNIKSKRDRLNMQIRNEELCAEAMKRPGKDQHCEVCSMQISIILVTIYRDNKHLERS